MALLVEISLGKIVLPSGVDSFCFISSLLELLDSTVLLLLSFFSNFFSLSNSSSKGLSESLEVIEEISIF